MRRWAAIPLSGFAALAAVALVSLATGAPAQLVQLLNGTTVVSASNPLPVTNTSPSGTQDVNLVEVGGNTLTTTVPVSGTVAATQSGSWTVTANAGTNLNTSALALEAGGNLAAIANAIAGTLTVEGAGVAGTPAGGVVTVQGAGSMTPLLVDGSGATQPVSGTVAATQSGSWSLAANQSVNVAQLAGTATEVNNGTASAGTLRVAIASDNTVLPAVGADATGTTVPANAVYQGNNVGGNTTGQIGCGSVAIYDASTSGNTELVALASSQTVYVCGYTIFTPGSVSVRLVTGTGSACATDEASVTPIWQFTAQSGVVDNSPIYRGLKSAVSSALCIETSGAVAVQAIVYYTQF